MLCKFYMVKAVHAARIAQHEARTSNKLQYKYR